MTPWNTPRNVLTRFQTRLLLAPFTVFATSLGVSPFDGFSSLGAACFDFRMKGRGLRASVDLNPKPYTLNPQSPETQKGGCKQIDFITLSAKSSALSSGPKTLQV